VISISKIKGVNDKISFSGRFKKGISKKSNTITNVLYLLRKRNFFQKQAFKIDIQKNIPHGSGLGGGSSNAANVLNFFNSKMRLKLNKDEISKIAYQIGFDTPVSLEKKNTLLTGKKGEILRLNQKFRLNILIVYPNVICSTKKIYANNKKFTFLRSQSNFYIKDKNKLIDFLKNENNDLEKTAIKFYPKVRKIINFIKSQNGCYFSRITGSGSACIGIFSNMKSAVFAQKFMKLKFPNYWCVVSKTI
jgi:4-diphosphocytidyl-2-C-methyl-D-erythritol kinase